MRRQPLQATTADGHEVRQQGRAVVCHHPACAVVPADGAIVAQPPHRIEEFLHLHVLRHDEAAQLQPRRTLDGHVVSVLGNGSIWCAHPDCSPGRETPGTPVAHPPQHQRLTALVEHVAVHDNRVQIPPGEGPSTGGSPSASVLAAHHLQAD